MVRIDWRETLTRLGVAVAVMIGAAQAFAATVTVQIESNAGGYDAYSTTVEATPNPDGTFSVAGLGYGAGGSFSCDWSIVLDQDPQMTSNVNLTNLSPVATQFTMTITLPIGLFGPATLRGGYFGDTANGTTFTDTSGNSDVTLSTFGGNPFYQALVNGILSQGLGSFTLNENGGSGIQGNLSQQRWGDTPSIPSAPFGPASGNMQIKWMFSLTGGDSMQTQGFFRIDAVAPEPATAALVGLGLVALVVARRRA